MMDGDREDEEIIPEYTDDQATYAEAYFAPGSYADDETNHVVPAYIRHPPVAWDSEADHDLLVRDWWNMIGVDSSLIDPTDNPVGAVDSIVARHRAGVYPSVATLDWLVDGLARWRESGGTGDLAQYLGLRGSSHDRGQAANKVKVADRKNRDGLILSTMNVLIAVLDLSKSEAADVVAAWLPERYPNDRSLSSATIESLWDKSKWHKNPEPRDLLKRRYWSDGARQHFIRGIPQHCWQHLHQLRRYLPK